ncbi:solute carrier family 15 member 1-like isoform X2 [Homarus americanus]|uniref:solute carrier family 15 member 1-like isoform X2 n=1 Tax=Homarus americanus TaxID=6706 RepID=UPI001C43E4DC|nr:solute carrier family 15 member 1-like isoform X2 [Homarus americanus]
MYAPLLSRDVWDEEEDDIHYPSYTVGDDGDDDEEVLYWSLDHNKKMECSKLLEGGEKMYDDPDQTEERVKYPRSVFFIIGTEFCERFSYYGMKAILTLYLHNELKFSEDSSTVIYHVWSMLCYFTPILGAIIADTLLGRFRTIFYISVLYVFGNAVLSLSAVPPVFPDLGPKIAVSLTGLFLIALGTGGIKPCVSAFGGDQFVLPKQERQLTQFFSIFYFSINAGSLLSTYITPILRDNVHCYGDDCYCLAFGIPAILMVVALLLFLAGHSKYIMKPPEGNILVRVWSCIMHALRQKCKTKENKEHWLDHASDKFDKSLISDVKVVLKILLLYIPLPFFWALFDQQGSRWTFQATRMDGQIGSWTVKPDQMQVVNPFLILLLIPIFDTLVYPVLARCNLLKRQLPRMFTGGVLAGIAFLVSGIVELKLEETYPIALENGETRLALINTLPCNIRLNMSWEEKEVNLTHLEQVVYKSINIHGQNATLNVTLDLEDETCGDVIHVMPDYEIFVTEKQAQTVLITIDTTIVQMVPVDPPDEYLKPSSGLPRLRMLYNLGVIPFNSTVLLKGKFDTPFEFKIKEKPQGYISGTGFEDVDPDNYEVYLPTSDGGHEKSPYKIDVKLGGVYNFLVQKSLDEAHTNQTTVKNFQITPPNSVHMLWLIPQYFIITVSEIMFSITGLEFSFTQAPISMKSVLQAAWLLTVSFGNLIVVIIAEAKFFKSQAMEFFLFAILMFIDMILFAMIAYRYKYIDELAVENNDKTEESEKGKCFDKREMRSRPGLL